jgi:hypothetical protein
MSREVCLRRAVLRFRLQVPRFSGIGGRNGRSQLRGLSLSESNVICSIVEIVHFNIFACGLKTVPSLTSKIIRSYISNPLPQYIKDAFSQPMSFLILDGKDLTENAMFAIQDVFDTGMRIQVSGTNKYPIPFTHNLRCIWLVDFALSANSCFSTLLPLQLRKLTRLALTTITN